MSESNEGKRSSEEIRRDIERTRSEMDETVDALENRLSPGQMLDEAWHLLKRQGGGAGDVVRDHPVPLALMGLGVAWLAIEKATGASVSADGDADVGPGTYARAEGRVGPYRGDAVTSADGRGALDRAKSKAAHASDTAREKLGEAGEWAKDKLPDGHDAEELRDRAGRMAAHAADSARQGARQAKRGFLSLLDEQPLALGALSFGLGIAAGAAVPTTRWEDEHMGDAADTLKHEVKEAAQETGEAARAAAGDAMDAARAEADRQDVRSQLADTAKRVASEAKMAARDRAARENLTADGLEDRAREIGRDTRDRATGER